MASTVNSKFLSPVDQNAIRICSNISNSLSNMIEDPDKKMDFDNVYGKISYTRDAGAGRGAGKLQRDALCTRGSDSQDPISNRNLRWSPIILCDEPVDYAKRIECLKVYNRELSIIIKEGSTSREVKFNDTDSYSLKDKYCITSSDFEKCNDELRNFSKEDWAKNNACIQSMESCTWIDAIESYAVLGISVATQLYGVDFMCCYNEITKLLEIEGNNLGVIMPTEKFPTDKNDIICDPLIKIPISSNLDQFRFSDRGTRWKPTWKQNKSKEGDDSTLQLMHVNPLVEFEMRHNALNARYGFRWTNVAMTDHTIYETVMLMERIVEAYNKELT